MRRASVGKPRQAHVTSMSQVTITLPDGASRAVSAGTPVRDVAAEISPGLAKAAYAAVVDGKLVDLSYPLAKDSAVRIVTDKNAEALPLLRHSKIGRAS